MPDFVVRDPVHGFISFDSWEKQIIDHPAFQRLRRIRQLGLTDQVYPGATHTRLEHSLGVMHLSSQMFDAIVAKRRPYLKSDRGYNDGGLDRDRRVVRLAALLHDVGHSPFSHSGESLMPFNPVGNMRYQHEDYSSAVIRGQLRYAIEQHTTNDNYGITADMIADLIIGAPTAGSARRMIWRPLVSGQLDADRCDYLLRDSIHAGVEYGKYDLQRILVTLNLGLNESDDPVIAIEEGGWHAAEGMIIARYMMFTQVYLQHTRFAFDHHIEGMLAELLATSRPEPTFPAPDSDEGIAEYLDWDDWKVLGRLVEGEGGEHAQCIKNRTHYRMAYNTPEVPSQEDIEKLEQVSSALGALVQFVGDASKSWYSFAEHDLPIVQADALAPQQGKPLSTFSRVIAGLSPVAERRIYVRESDRDEARHIITQLNLGGR